MATEVKTPEEFSAAVAAAGKDVLVVAYFWADFHEACKPGGQMDQVLALLQTRHAASAKFLKADAEPLFEVAESLGVSVVPSFVFLSGGVKVGMTEGASPAKLQAALDKALAGGKSAEAGSGDESLTDRLRRLTTASPVVLFMKGSAAEPKCKFSRAMVDLLAEHSVQYSTFDILQDSAVREGLKDFANWKTFPQLWVGGALVGGLDAVKELADADALRARIAGAGDDAAQARRRPAVQPTAPPQQQQPPRVVDDAFLQQLVARSPVMLFMKGSPDAPACGFSSKIVALLRAHKLDFGSFDILGDEQVRQQLKTFSKWPTYPQLYVNGALVGGLDIVQEMADEEGEDGDLAAALGVEKLEARLQRLVRLAPNVLFMKGDPDAPRCGFSREIVALLREEGIPFASFDILSDEQVRQGLKDLAKWPTFPMLFADGALVGGLDIVRELRDDGELRDAVSKAE